MLRNNGARENCLLHCPQGVPDTTADALSLQTKEYSATAGKVFVVGYVGRVTEVKGVQF